MGATLACNICLKKNQPSKDWTCACGYGYWDEVKKQFITGSQVRERHARSKEEYLDHLESCVKCKIKAEEDGLTTSSNGYLLPRDDIPLEVIEEYVRERLGASASGRAGTYGENGMPGYYIYSQEKPPQSIITDLIYRAQLETPTPSSVSRDPPQALGWDRPRLSSERQDRGRRVLPQQEQRPQNRRRSSQQHANLLQVSPPGVSQTSEEIDFVQMPYGSDSGETRTPSAVELESSNSPTTSFSTYSEDPQPTFSGSYQGLASSEPFPYVAGYTAPARPTKTYPYPGYTSPGLIASTREQEELNSGNERMTIPLTPRNADGQAADTTPSMPSSSGVWKFHEKYRRYYRDYEADGRFWRQYDNSNGPVVSRTAPSTAYLASQQVPRAQNLGPTLASQPYEAQPQAYGYDYQYVSSGLENLALEQPNVEPAQQSQDTVQQPISGGGKSRGTREIRGKPKGHQDRKGKDRR